MNDAASKIADLAEALASCLDAMTNGPSQIAARLKFELSDRFPERDPEKTYSLLRTAVMGGDSRLTSQRLFARKIRGWDAEDQAAWAQATPRLTSDRRQLIYANLGLDAAWAQAITETIPVFKSFDQAILISDEHQDWYSTSRVAKTGSFFWSHYKKYLRERNGWDEDSLETLDDATDKVLKCLSDPERQEAYSTRGLVVGYVQSGKTANFTAVATKAIDAGYRVVIVLAGTLDSLRFQTQRRLDKELSGKEQILRDAEDGSAHEYAGDRDWKNFAEYGDLPSKLGSVDVRRITTSKVDYQKLGVGREVLRLEVKHQDRTVNSFENLAEMPARLFVIKKHPAIINKVIRDFKALKAPLYDFPVLVIDDESDQASVNTINPDGKKKSGSEEKKRTSTNNAILSLLTMFPRVQYVGYTATPAANVLVNPGDFTDLFPRDFIELLPRPQNYMGVSDFHDFDEEFNPLNDDEIDALGYQSNRKAFVRRIEDDDDGKMLRHALDAFFLAGAMKLFRADRMPGSVSTRHHTMLVHSSSQRLAHDNDRERVVQLIHENGYKRKSSLARLWQLWKEDFEPVSRVKEPNLPRPDTFAEILPFMEAALRKFEEAKPVLIVNGEIKNRDDMPDFDKEDVWNILVGGAKLSRGYTVEGLTTTYFLRKAGAADALMQMGRWFGFRRGYRDLVRLYIGTQVQAGKPAATRKDRKSQKKSTVDLYEMFESICMDEEKFRKRIELYSSDGDRRIRPLQVPPLVPMGMLIPTQKNKMFNAEISMENFGGRTAESGRTTFKPKQQEANVSAFSELLSDKCGETVRLEGGSEKGRQSLAGTVFSVSSLAVVQFLERYKWGTDQSQFAGVIQFLRGTADQSPGIDAWRVILMSKPSARSQWEFGGSKLGVFTRGLDGGRFKVFSELRHREIAKHLAEIKVLSNPSDSLRRLVHSRQGVLLVYPVVSTDFSKQQVADQQVTLGLSLTFPKNSMRQRMDWRVKNSSSKIAFVDSAES